MSFATTHKTVNLDFMRSIAVMLVVGAHTSLYTGFGAYNGWSGLTGVCMFFVHTTLVLMWSLERNEHVGQFYLRRMFRIYPLWLAVLALVLILHLPQFPPDFVFHWPSARELLFNVLLLGNLKYGTLLVGASWTLPIEVQMYLFLPFLFFFARANRRVWPLIVIDLFVMFFDRLSYPAVYSGLPMCVAYFLPGVMAYTLSKKAGIARLPAWSFPVFLLGIVALDCYKGTYRMSWIFCLVLGLAIPTFKDMTAKPIQLASHYIAKYSYGIYLTHISALAIAIHVLRHHSREVRFAVFIGLFCVLPVAFYHAVEEPMIRLGARLASRIKTARPVPRITENELELEMAP